MVTVELIGRDGMTTVLVTHEALAEGAMTERHAAGWRDALQRLDDWLLFANPRR